MKQLWLIPIIGLLGLASTIISSKGSLFDKRFKWYKRLTQRGLITALIGLAIVGLSIWQYISIKKDEEIQRKISDSTITSEINREVDLNRQKLFTDLSEALAKQNLRLDTVTKKIESLRDSARTVILNSPKESPVIIVRDKGITHSLKKDTLEIKISLISTQAPANIIYIKVFWELNYEDGTKEPIVDSERLLSGVTMPKDQSLSLPFSFIQKKQIDFLRIALLGRYTQVDSKKEIKLQDVYLYSLTKESVGFMQGEAKNNFLKTYNLN